MARTEDDYEERNKRLREMGITPAYNSLKEERKAKREMNKLAREMGYGGGIDQATKELKEVSK